MKYVRAKEKYTTENSYENFKQRTRGKATATATASAKGKGERENKTKLGNKIKHK